MMAQSVIPRNAGGTSYSRSLSHTLFLSWAQKPLPKKRGAEQFLPSVSRHFLRPRPCRCHCLFLSTPRFGILNREKEESERSKQERERETGADNKPGGTKNSVGEAEAKGRRKKKGEGGEGRARRVWSRWAPACSVLFLCVAVSSGFPVVRCGGIGLRKFRSCEQFWPSFIHRLNLERRFW